MSTGRWTLARTLYEARYDDGCSWDVLSNVSKEAWLKAADRAIELLVDRPSGFLHLHEERNVELVGGHPATIYKTTGWDEQPPVPDMAWNYGIYRVHWRSGGSSLAAVGVSSGGKRWLAPLNWSSPANPFEDWADIEHMTNVTPVSP